MGGRFVFTPIVGLDPSDRGPTLEGELLGAPNNIAGAPNNFSKTPKYP